MKNASNKQVEEALAEDFRKYMLETVPSKVYRITKWFNKLIDFVYSLVGRIRPTSIFRGIYEGKYANIPVTQEAKDRFMVIELILHSMVMNFRILNLLIVISKL